MLGRGLRLHPGKEDCLVIDFTDRVHNLRQPIVANKVGWGG
jgi:superfamily II DNA or RNA helicase